VVGASRAADRLDLLLPSPLQELSDELLHDHKVRVLLKREDLIHAEIPGNKWRKLRYNLVAAADSGSRTLLTFGGAYSNHIRATAAAGHYFGFSTIGVIRGEEHLPLNPSLAYAVNRGMTLAYLDRTTYRSKESSVVMDSLRARFGDFYAVPEGGSNELGVRGCAEVPGEVDADFDLICCPCGSGGTLAGVAAGLDPGQRAIGFSAIRGGEYLANEIDRLQRRTFERSSGNWVLEHEFHFGGFARTTDELAAFIKAFRARHGVELDRVYVAKMMYGLFATIRRGDIEPGSTLVALVTG
jgi:1-aminocyclopropane-1-carboxylate deaminase